MSELLCARPHEKDVDFRTARFVVGRESGLDVGTVEGVRHLEFGEEVPAEVLDEVALRQLYTYPMPHMIELLEYAVTIPDIREACARKGIVMAEPVDSGNTSVETIGSQQPAVGEPSPDLRQELDLLSRKQLSDLCYKKGLPSDGSKQTLRDRLAAALANSVGHSGRTVG